MEMALEIISLNAHGLNSPFKRSMLWRECLALKGNVVCVQETHFSKTKHPKCSHKNFPYIYEACADTKKAGVMIVINKDVAFRHIESICDPKGRYIILICELNNSIYTFVNVYAPNTGQATFLRFLAKKIHKNKKGLLLVCGDFNSVVDRSMDCSRMDKSNRYELK